MVWPGWGHGKAGSSLLRGVKRDSRRGNERREREKEKKSKEVMGKADESTVERTHALRSVACRSHSHSTLTPPPVRQCGLGLCIALRW